MTSLIAMLDQASEHGATDLVVEPGCLPLFNGVSVPERSNTVTEAEVFEGLSALLGPDQQAQLAMGQVVEFQLERGPTRWTIVAESRGQKMVLRGRVATEGRAPDTGPPLELPPLERVEVEASAAVPPAAGSLLQRLRHTPRELPAVEAVASTVTGQTSSRTLQHLPIPQTSRPTLLDVPPGTLAWVAHGWARSERLMVAHSDAKILIRGGKDVPAAWPEAPGLIVVSMADPSGILGWLLGRLEEGYSVLVETRARTEAGARRILLGVNAGSCAREWLEAIPQRWIVPATLGPDG